MKNLSFLLSLLLAITLFSSCEKDPIDSPQEEVAPQLPPPETFIMPFAGFEDADTTGFKGKDSFEEKTYRSWFYAASHVVVWNTVLGLNMAIPTASFHEAFNHTPTFIGDGTWKWTYQHQLAGQTYVVSLTGKFINNNEEVQWVTTISQVGGFTDVVWYTGIVSIDFTKASWTLFHQPANPQAYLNIDYEYNKSTDQFFIRYTNIISGSPDNGDYIEYRANTDTDFNRAYDIFRINENKFIEMQWNEPVYDGRVKSPTDFGDDNWRCWDAAQMDTDC